MRHLAWVAALAAASLAVPAAGQQASSVQAHAGFAPVQAPCVQQADKSCKPVGTDPTTGVVTLMPTTSAAGRATTNWKSCVTDATAATEIALVKCTVGQNTTALIRLAGILSALQATLTTSGPVTASALPAGAATSARQDVLVTALGTPAQAPAAATSTPALGTITISAITPTSGTGTLASGVATIPFQGQIGLPIRIILRVSGGTFTAYVGHLGRRLRHDQPARVANDLLARTQKPAVVVLDLGYNDAGGNMMTVATNFAATVAAIRAGLPGAKVLAIAPATPLGASTDLDTVRSTVMAAATTANVPFFDVRNWINSSNATI